MHPLAATPHFALDHEAREQIRQTRGTLRDTLASEPDRLLALVMADVLEELAPDRDRVVADHVARFRATRRADWRVQARAEGVDRLLYHLAAGWREARIGGDAAVILERRAAEIGEARPAGTRAGLIDAAYVPDALVDDTRCTIAYHPSGHLQRVAVDIDDLHRGTLELAEAPGAGSFTFIEKRGGYGTMINDRYRDGAIVTTLNTPWHDGEESRSERPWTRWVEECLAELARLSAYRPRAKRPARRRSR